MKNIFYLCINRKESRAHEVPLCAAVPLLREGSRRSARRQLGPLHSARNATRSLHRGQIRRAAASQMMRLLGILMVSVAIKDWLCESVNLCLHVYD